MNIRTFNLQQIEEELRDILHRDYGISYIDSVWFISYTPKHYSDNSEKRIEVGIELKPLGVFSLIGDELTVFPSLGEFPFEAKVVESISDGLHYLLSKNTPSLEF